MSHNSRYWIFKASPDRYDLDRRLKDPDPSTSWRASQYTHRINPGDFAFVWRARGEHEPDHLRGFCAILVVEQAASEMPELPHELSYWKANSVPGTDLMVLASYVSRFPLIPAGVVRATPGLESLTVFQNVEDGRPRFTKSTNYEMSWDEGQALLRLIFSRQS